LRKTPQSDEIDSVTDVVTDVVSSVVPSIITSAVTAFAGLAARRRDVTHGLVQYLVLLYGTRVCSRLVCLV
jgi:hypothetical protein